jgi:hypothetical protein
MTDAIDHYNQAGREECGGFAPVQWPDIALTEESVVLFVEGVLAERLNFAEILWGNEMDIESLDEKIVESSRLLEMQLRYAPEGIYIRSRMEVMVTLMDQESADFEADDILEVEVEMCLSYTEKNHTCPFVDVMGGVVRVSSDGREMQIEAYSYLVRPEDAVDWGMNGAGKLG